MSSLYDRLGGRPAVEAAVETFYGKVLADPHLAPMFDGIDTRRLAGHQIRFMTMAFGGPSEFGGRPLGAAHSRLVSDKALGDFHFDRVAGHLQATLEELQVPADLTLEVMTLVGSTRDEVLGRTGA